MYGGDGEGVSWGGGEGHFSILLSSSLLSSGLKKSKDRVAVCRPPGVGGVIGGYTSESVGRGKKGKLFLGKEYKEVFVGL